MRLLFVVQRYGTDIAGGAEQHCRQFAVRLAARGHEVEVLTSRARSSKSWDNEFPRGPELIEGVTVHRLSTLGPRDSAAFDRLSGRALWSGPPADVSQAVGETWVTMQGPFLPDLVPWLRANSRGYDVVIFFTYLYFPSWAGLRVAAERVPTVFHATAHDEPPLWLRTYDRMLSAPATYAWSTEEEKLLLRRRGVPSIPGDVIGIGVEDITPAAKTATFRSRYGLQDRPYLLCLGRVAEAKGSLDLAAWFAAYKERFPGPLLLVLAGEADTEIQAHPDVLVTGFLGDQERAGALSDCLALVQPSYKESFSMVVAEAWAAGKPVLVQGRSDVLRGQARRSGAALCFEGWVEFMAAVELLLTRTGLAGELAAAGKSYVERNYSWESVMTRYEALLERTCQLFATRAGA